MKTIKIQKKSNKHVQVRQEVFESNSSSSHSVTISKKGFNHPNKAQRPLVVDNILYPDRLNDYSVEFGDAWGISCFTKETKAAIVCNWVGYVLNNDYGDYLRPDGKRDENKVENLIAEIFQKIGKECGYAGVDLEYDDTFYPHSEYGGDVNFPCDLDSEDDVDSLKKTVDDLILIILDDTMEITEGDTPD